MSKSTKTRSRNDHPLAKQHFNRVVRRPERKRKPLHTLLGVTWNLRGKTFLPLGKASMMAMSSHPDPTARNGEVIELLCVCAQFDPKDGSIHYSDVRMAHDFKKNPHVGARGRILDPREEREAVKKGDCPNASWVRLGLELDRARDRAAQQNWKLPVVPTLPTFYAGYSAMSAIDMEMSHALKQRIAAHMQKSLSEIGQMDDGELDMLAKAEWPSLWKAPHTGGNPTGLWLIDAAFTTQLGRASQLFEDFSEMVGVDCWNPTRDIQAIEFANPAIQLATDAGFDLVASLAMIDAGEVETEEGVTAYDVSVDNILAMRPLLRAYLGEHAKHFDDTELDTATIEHDKPITLVIEDVLGTLGAVDAVRMARQQLETTRPLFAAGTTDEDLLAALKNPDGPLFSSLTCQLQVMKWDPRLGPEEAFSFSSDDLGRERVFSKLWATNSWSPQTQERKHGKRREGRKQPQYATTE